jgi:hypothetical protein
LRVGTDIFGPRPDKANNKEDKTTWVK